MDSEKNKINGQNAIIQKHSIFIRFIQLLTSKFKKEVLFRKKYNHNYCSVPSK